MLTPPNAQISDVTGILPGLDGRKMSKSYKNTIPIFSDDDELRKTVMKIKTNSQEPGEPKESNECNVFNIFRSIGSEKEILDLQKKYDEGIGWGDAKSILNEKLREFLSPYKSEYNKIIQDRGYVESVLSIGKEKALEISSPLIKDLREAIGIKGF